ncbi:uncharacterized protein PG986_005605 [Apiospora aurea]|uniref:Uncharacterized protein n=1 Tax=Apiospora aurea TaxID=335848 RepID=A0ABR1QIB8_9PEZI
MAKYAYHDVDVRTDQSYKDGRDGKDLIFCNADHIIKDDSRNEKNIHWFDTAQMVPVVDGDPLLSLKDPTSNSVMFVTKDSRSWTKDQGWPEHAPGVIAFHPRILKAYVDKNTRFDSDRVDRALSPTLLDGSRRAHPRLRDFKPVHILRTPEFTMLQEMTHMIVTVESDNDDGGYRLSGE